MPDTWYAYECDNVAGCPAIKAGTGSVLDARLPWDRGAPEVRCPACQEPMRFRGCWEADDAGYGSRGDIGMHVTFTSEGILSIDANSVEVLPLAAHSLARFADYHGWPDDQPRLVIVPDGFDLEAVPEDVGTYLGELRVTVVERSDTMRPPTFERGDRIAWSFEEDVEEEDGAGLSAVRRSGTGVYSHEFRGESYHSFVDDATGERMVLATFDISKVAP